MMTNKPKKPQVMKSVTVDTKGVDVPGAGEAAGSVPQITKASRAAGRVTARPVL